MKQIILTTLLLTSSATVFARPSGSISLRDGKRIIRISVDENSSRYRNESLEDRLYRLEYAVMELQDKVYDLERNDQVTSSVTCTISTKFDGVFIGKGSTQIEAEAIARKSCNDKLNSDFWCSRGEVRCERSPSIP